MKIFHQIFFRLLLSSTLFTYSTSIFAASSAAAIESGSSSSGSSSSGEPIRDLGGLRLAIQSKKRLAGPSATAGAPAAPTLAGSGGGEKKDAVRGLLFKRGRVHVGSLASVGDEPLAGSAGTSGGSTPLAAARQPSVTPDPRLAGARFSAAATAATGSSSGSLLADSVIPSFLVASMSPAVGVVSAAAGVAIPASSGGSGTSSSSADAPPLAPSGPRSDVAIRSLAALRDRAAARRAALASSPAFLAGGGGASVGGEEKDEVERPVAAAALAMAAATAPSAISSSSITPDLNTLSGLSYHIFSRHPEISFIVQDPAMLPLFSPAQQSLIRKIVPTMVIPYENFIALERRFFATYARDLNNKTAWLEEDNIPDAHFFNFDARIQDVDETNFPYVQRKFIPSGSEVCFMGDLHGDVHALLRNLWRLVAMGYLDNNFAITKPNFNMIFTGDFVDRGSYGTEVLYVLMLLKITNNDRVILLRGNHEDIGMSAANGFKEEVLAKYQDRPDAHAIFSRINRLLPYALYLGSGRADDKNAAFVQCCHGGIEIGFDPKPLIESKKAFQIISDDVPDSCKVLCEGLHGWKHTKNGRIIINKDNCCTGFQWSDFKQTGSGEIEINASRGAGYMADVLATVKYLNANPCIKAFFRGHQDMYCGFKIFYWPTEVEEDTFDTEAFACSSKITPHRVGGYGEGPYYYQEVLRYKEILRKLRFPDEKAEEKDENPGEVPALKVSDYVPIFTFTTAVSARGLAHDSFGMATTADTWENWVIRPYEFPLSDHAKTDPFAYHAPDLLSRHNKFVVMRVVADPKVTKDFIKISFEDTPNAYPIDTTLLLQAINQVRQ